MEYYHGILIDASFGNLAIFDQLEVIGQRKTSNGEWILYNIQVAVDNIEEVIRLLQQHMNHGFYCHFYKDNQLIVVFKERIFRLTVDKSTWKEAVDYGRSVGISDEQLDFYPCKVEEE